MHSFIFLWKIVLVSSFCTSRRIASSSHTPSMLRTRYLALHKNNLTIDDFEQVGSDWLFFHQSSVVEMLT